jgi:hypothetical protein
MQAAKLVRNATTANGENPCVMASFPKTGANPRNSAELKAAIIPAVCFFCKDASLYGCSCKGIVTLLML